MRKQTEEYFTLVKHLIQLQQKLVPAFEETVEVKPYLFESAEYSKIIQPGRGVSEIVQNWSKELQFFAPMVFWVQPTAGVIQADNRNWLFKLHGSLQVSFQCLPSTLEKEILTVLKQGHTRAWYEVKPRWLHYVDVYKDQVSSEGLPTNSSGTEYLPLVDVTYLEGGRTDGVRAWSMHLFIETGGYELSSLKLDEHKRFLAELVDAGLLLKVFGEDEPHYILTNAEVQNS